MKDEEIMLKMMYDKLSECFNTDNSVPKWKVNRDESCVRMYNHSGDPISLTLEYDKEAEEWLFSCDCTPYYIIASVDEIIEEINNEYPYPEVTYEVYDRLVGKSCGEYADEADALKQIEYLKGTRVFGGDFVIRKITREVMV